MRMIDADALKEYFKTIQKYHVGKYSEWYLADVLEQQPTVDAELVRHGYWIRKEWAEESEGLLIDNYECSACKSWVRNETNYCPNCGAKMDAERKSE